MEILFKTLAALFVGFLLFVILLQIDGCVGTNEKHNAIVIDKKYHAPYTSLHCSSTGKTTTCHTQYHPARWVCEVKMGNGETHSAKCDQALYDRKQLGDLILININKGKFTGMIVSIRGIE